MHAMLDGHSKRMIAQQWNKIRARSDTQSGKTLTGGIGSHLESQAIAILGNFQVVKLKRVLSGVRIVQLPAI